MYHYSFVSDTYSFKMNYKHIMDQFSNNKKTDINLHHNHPHYFIFSEYLLQIFVTVCRSTLVYICKLFLCLLYLILILRNLHPASLFHSVNKRLTYCLKDLVLTQWCCFRLKVIWLPSPLAGISTLRSKPFHFCILFSVEDPLIFRPNWGLKGWNWNFFRPGRPLISGSGWPQPRPPYAPFIGRSGSATDFWQKRPYFFAPSIKKWYPFHMSSNGPCIPFLNPLSGSERTYKRGSFQIRTRALNDTLFYCLSHDNHIAITTYSWSSSVTILRQTRNEPMYTYIDKYWAKSATIHLGTLQILLSY